MSSNLLGSSTSEMFGNNQAVLRGFLRAGGGYVLMKGRAAFTLCLAGSSVAPFLAAFLEHLTLRLVSFERISYSYEEQTDSALLTQGNTCYLLSARWLRGIHASGALAGGAMVRETGAERAAEKQVTTFPMSYTPQSALDRRYPHLSATAGRGGGRRAALLVGLPVITSPKGLRFWLDLCGVGNNPGLCKQAFEAFGNNTPVPISKQPQQYKPSSSGFASENAFASSPPYGQAWLETTVSRLTSLHELGVAGVHVMAPGRGPRRRAIELASRGVFGPPRRRQQE